MAAGVLPVREVSRQSERNPRPVTVTLAPGCTVDVDNVSVGDMHDALVPEFEVHALIPPTSARPRTTPYQPACRISLPSLVISTFDTLKVVDNRFANRCRGARPRSPSGRVRSRESPLPFMPTPACTYSTATEADNRALTPLSVRSLATGNAEIRSCRGSGCSSVCGQALPGRLRHWTGVGCCPCTLRATCADVRSCDDRRRRAGLHA